MHHDERLAPQPVAEEARLYSHERVYIDWTRCSVYCRGRCGGQGRQLTWSGPPGDLQKLAYAA